MAEQEFEIDQEGVWMMTEAILTEGYTYKDFTSITDQETEAAYAVAYNLVNQGQYGQADKLFEFLCQLDHYDPRFWMGLGVCRQQLKRYEPASKAFAMVGVLDVENPMPALRAAECYLALGQLEAAESGLTAALHWAGDQAKHEAVRTRAQALLESLERRKETE